MLSFQGVATSDPSPRVRYCGARSRAAEERSCGAVGVTVEDPNGVRLIFTETPTWTVGGDERMERIQCS
jgi:hypothetical protein